jgi:hypothetical protein
MAFIAARSEPGHLLIQWSWQRQARAQEGENTAPCVVPVDWAALHRSERYLFAPSGQPEAHLMDLAGGVAVVSERGIRVVEVYETDL